MKKLIQFELRKIFSKRLTQASLIALFLLSVFSGFFAYQNMYAPTGKAAREQDRSLLKLIKLLRENMRDCCLMKKYDK